MSTRRDWQQLRTSRSRLFPTAIATFTLVTAGGVLFGVGLHDHGITDSVPGWTSTTGIVIGSHESTGSGAKGPPVTSYAPIISFRDQQGAPVTFTGPGRTVPGFMTTASSAIADRVTWIRTRTECQRNYSSCHLTCH